MDELNQKRCNDNSYNILKEMQVALNRKMLSFFGNSKIRKKRSRNVKLPVLLKIHPIKQYKGRQFVNDDDPECFHRAISSILLLAQFFGILPIEHIRAHSIKKFSFRRFSPYAIYSYFVLLAIIIMTSISVIHLLKTLNADSFQTKGGIPDATAGAVFYGNSLFGNIMFLRLCPKWISIQYDWIDMERILDDDYGKHEKWKRPRLRWRFSIISWTILSLALLEHILSIISHVPLGEWGCHSFPDFLLIYANKSHHFIIKNSILGFFDYNFSLGMFIFIISKVATFTWNFTDLFIMLISTALAERYKCLNNSILGMTPTHLTITDWYRFRESYAVLSALVKKVDQEISGIVLLSFTNNLYFICLQLLNGLSPNNPEIPTINSIYFFGSFLFLIGRTTAVTLLTARINDQCKVILPVLYNCPSVNYCLEVGGAVVTYEIVLLQFNIAIQR